MLQVLNKTNKFDLNFRGKTKSKLEPCFLQPKHKQSTKQDTDILLKMAI